MRKADDFVAISALRSCMSETTWSSVSPSCAISLVARASGITPIARPPAREDRVGDDAHQPDPAAAVDQVNLVSRERFAHLASRFRVRGRDARRRAAVDADGGSLRASGSIRFSMNRGRPPIRLVDLAR